MITLRPYQIDAVDRIEQALGTAAKVLLVAPTGAGKTEIASSVIKHKVEQYKSVLFLAHRREIITQASAKLTANGVRHGIIMAGVEPRPIESVQVASIDTLHVRGVRSKAMSLPPAKLVADMNRMLNADSEAYGSTALAELYLDGETPIEARAEILARLASGETEVVINCMVLTEGWDMPAVGCAILARPTRQMGLYRQMIGRVLRPSDGKPDAIILDHSGAVYRHGLPEDFVEWTLDVDQRAVNPAQVKRERGEEPKLHECPSCKAVMVAPPCGACGWQPQPRARAIDFEDGELGLVANGKAKAQAYSTEEKQAWFQMMVGEALRRGKKNRAGLGICSRTSLATSRIDSGIAQPSSPRPKFPAMCARASLPMPKHGRRMRRHEQTQQSHRWAMVAAPDRDAGVTGVPRAQRLRPSRHIPH
jgi:superfamily II DNA or RNA helicase